MSASREAIGRWSGIGTVVSGTALVALPQLTRVGLGPPAGEGRQRRLVHVWTVPLQYVVRRAHLAS